MSEDNSKKHKVKVSKMCQKVSLNTEILSTDAESDEETEDNGINTEQETSLETKNDSKKNCLLQ